jgi:hypothetical protein
MNRDRPLAAEDAIRPITVHATNRTVAFIQLVIRKTGSTEVAIRVRGKHKAVTLAQSMTPLPQELIAFMWLMASVLSQPAKVERPDSCRILLELLVTG